MSQAFYRKWRPQQWDQVVGQQHVTQTLRNAVANEQIRHAYLFAGPRGTGKTTTARLLAKAVNCLDPDPAARPCNHCDICVAINEGRFLDLIEIDAASNTSVEDVRDLREKINFAPTQGKFKVYIIDEVHMLSSAAFNALLKTLEEPPPHAIFILATTEVHKIPATVLSRCQRHEFRRIPVPEIVARLKEICKEEGLKAEPEALTLIARQATGSLRDAISLLDQLSSLGKKISLKETQEVLGTATSQVVVDLVDAILERDAARGLERLHAALDAGADARQLARQLVEYLRSLLLVRMGNADQVEATQEQRATMARQAALFEVPRLLEVMRAFNEAATDLRGGWQPALPLELALAESVVEKPSSPPLDAAATTPAPRPAHLERPAAPAVPSAANAPPPQNTAAEADKTVISPEAKGPKAPTIPAVKSEAALPEARPDEPAQISEGPISFQTVKQNWARIKAQVKKSRTQTEALLNSCRLLGIKDGVLVLGFSTELLKGKMENGNNLALTEKALEQVLGAKLPIRCVIASGKTGGIPEDITIEEDGMVAAALRDMGGEVVDYQE
jgi:DNA polymerase-3 subunit gamma/tau